MTKRPISRLRRWRLQNGFTEQEIADLAGLSESMISRAERGQRRLSPAAKARLARVLEVRIADLFEPPEGEIEEATG